MEKMVFVLMMLLAPFAWAQSASGGSDEISLYLGEMLPSGIEHVTEVLPVFGARYGLQTSRVGIAELGLFNTHAQGVDFTTFEASLRGTIETSPGMDVVYFGGADLNYYRPENEESRKTVTGFHLGAGGMMQVTDTLWLRGDLKFMGGPGTSLYLLFGLVFR
jgi:hypothetical protein